MAHLEGTLYKNHLSLLPFNCVSAIYLVKRAV